MKHPDSLGRIRRLAFLLATTALSPLATGQTIPDVAPEIVSAWADGEDALLIFRYDGTYYMAQDSATEPGMEHGTFIWDKATSDFSATPLVDTNGEAGLSHPSGSVSLSIIENTLTYTAGDEGSFTFSRVVNTASAIVGSWFVPGENFTITFLSDGTYFHTEQANDAPYGYDGMERGAYSWSPTTHSFTASATTDTNGDVGLNNPAANSTVTISGNALTFSDENGSTVLHRITTNAIPLPVPVFNVEKFANYTQKSATVQALASSSNPGRDIYPYWGEAYIDFQVPATPALKIGSQADQSFVGNLDSGWEIGKTYTSGIAMDDSSAFPNGVNYVFKSGTDTATLSYPSVAAYPPKPAVIQGNGSWISNIYRLDVNGTLSWTGHTNFDPATHVTLLSIADIGSQTSLSADGTDLLKELLIQGNVTSYDLSGKLTAGRNYLITVELEKIAGSTTSGTGVFAGKLGYSLYNSNTSFILKATADPATAPVITHQPVSQLAEAGDDILLTVAADGSPTPAYQWFKDGVALPGQTGNSLSLFNFDISKRGAYMVMAMNSEGMDTSSTAWLSGPPVVEYVVVGKEIEHVQTGPSTVVVKPVSEYYGGAYGFSAHVSGQGMQLLAAPTVAPPAGTQDPFYSTLFLDEWDEPEWGYGPDANGGESISQAGIDARFPNGTYTFSVDGVSVPLSLTGNAYPNTPQLTLSGGTWINGKYAMDAANSLTVTTNAFTGYGSHVDALIDLWVNDSGIESFRSSGATANFATYTVPANTLPTDWITEVGAGFISIVSESTAIPGAYAAAYYEKSVEMEVHILPKILAQTSSQSVGTGDYLSLAVDATGSPAAASYRMNYQWSKGGTILNGETDSVLYLSDFQAIDAGSYTCTVSNDVGTATSQPVVLSLPDGFADFVLDYDLDPLTTGAPAFDFDKDGVSNLLEYLFGTNPTLPGGNLLPTLTKAPGSSNVVFTYQRKLAATGVTQVVEHATSLSSTWTVASSGQGGVVVSTNPVDTATEQVTVTIPSTTASRFVRLKATR